MTVTKYVLYATDKVYTITVTMNTLNVIRHIVTVTRYSGTVTPKIPKVNKKDVT